MLVEVAAATLVVDEGRVVLDTVVDVTALVV
jgi:hypothetical protein